ncbi:MAG: glycoside hydrolase family 30 beta sandwich domain-containing protein [Eubacteriales bacterium]|nr:glycoside hydrolase family 30 beta sandwich domain-containing protein [Eubacteriales bacterium]
MNVTHIMSLENECFRPAQVMPGKAEDGDLRLGEARQEVLGFGGCFNELGWQALQRTQAGQREAYLDELFGEEGCAFNFGRVPIGANDFSLEWYSCDETDGDYALEHFNIDRDKEYTLPFVKAAQARCPEMALFASPWSPPTWMKTRKAYNYGRIRMEPEVLRAYAQYFVKFVQAYAAQGVPVEQVHVQNEPMADQKFPSCLWYGEDMRVFIADYLGPAFEAAGLDTELWLGTINGPFFDFMSVGEGGGGNGLSEFYDQFANTILSDARARRYISGVGMQWGGKHMLEQIEASYPELRVMQTESECGDGRNSWTHLEYIFGLMWFYFRHGAERFLYWNLALTRGEASTWGWSQNALCTVDRETGELERQPEFYLMKHLSRFVRRGAHVRRTVGSWSANTIAFENPDGSVVLVVASNMARERVFTFTHGQDSFSAVVPPHSVHTFVVNAG